MTALVSEPQADRMLRQLPKRTLFVRQDVDTEQMALPERAMGFGKKAGAQIWQRLRQLGKGSAAMADKVC